MAEERKGGPARRDNMFRGTRVPVAVAAGLVVVFVAGAFLTQAFKGSKPADRTSRAVIVPTGDRARMVVVPPCATGVRVAASTAAGQMRTLGATTIQLPQAPGFRVLVVPRCGAGRAGTTGTSPFPSAVFVLREGTRIKAGRPANGSTTPTKGVLSQLIVPTGSEARTIVVPQCTRPATTSKAGNGRGVVLTPRPAHPNTAIAPPC
jgi:hypothetical protein